MISAIATLAGLLLTTVMTGVVFAVRQEGRINAHGQLFIEREKQANLQYAALLTQITQATKQAEQQHSAVTVRLDHIEGGLQQLLMNQPES